MRKGDDGQSLSLGRRGLLELFNNLADERRLLAALSDGVFNIFQLLGLHRFFGNVYKAITDGCVGRQQPGRVAGGEELGIAEFGLVLANIGLGIDGGQY